MKPSNGSLEYILRYGPGEHEYVSASRIEELPSLIGLCVGVQVFDIIMRQNGQELGRAVYDCLDASSHWFRVVEEVGQAVGFVQKLAVPAGDGAWVVKAKEIDTDQPLMAVHYYEWLLFFAVPQTDAEKEAIQLEIQEMEEQAKLLGLRFQWAGQQEFFLEEIEEVGL